MEDQKFVAEQIIKKVFVNRQLSDIEEEKEDDRCKFPLINLQIPALVMKTLRRNSKGDKKEKNS